jgi:hypothetical protein
MVDGDTGEMVNGVFTPEYGPDAMRWTLQFDHDPISKYTYVAFFGQAEPGDKGCSEWLQLGNQTVVRDTSESAAFGPVSAEDGSIDDALQNIPLTISQLKTFGIDADSSLPTQQLLVTGTQLSRLIGDVGGLEFSYPDGVVKLESSGETIHRLSISSKALNGIEDSGESITYDVLIEPLPPDAKRLTAQSAFSEGICPT